MIYAIDFGTSNSLLGAASGINQLHAPIPLDMDAKDPSILRSVIFFPDQSKPYFGTQAIEQYVKHGQDEQAGRLIRSVKKFLPQKSFIGTMIGGKNVTLEEIIATFLREMRTRANLHFQREVTQLVLGRPARFAEDETLDRMAETRLAQAAKLAGFNEITFCPEPIAAAYEFKSTLTAEKIVLVADFGGGTSDFAVIRLTPHPQIFKPSDVLSIGGLAVAGDALDGALMRKGISPHFGSAVQYKVPFGSNTLTMPTNLMENICSPADISILRERDNLEFFRNVRSWALSDHDREKIDQLFTLIDDHLGFAVFEEIERTKKSLGQRPNEKFNFNQSGIKIEEDITARDFEFFARERTERILRTIDETVKKAGLLRTDIDLICATGGTAKVPALLRGLSERFGAEKVMQHDHFHSITQGLTRYAEDLYR